MPEHPPVLAEVHRVLAPGGFFQLSMTHPCFQTPLWEWVKDADGRRRGVICGDYYRELHGEIEEWTFGAALRAGETVPRKFRIPRFTHTLSTWLNLFLDAGFIARALRRAHRRRRHARRPSLDVRPCPRRVLPHHAPAQASPLSPFRFARTRLSLSEARGPSAGGIAEGPT